MADTTTSTPSVTATPTPTNQTQGLPGYTSTDPAVQARIAEMQKQVAAQSSTATAAPAPATAPTATAVPAGAQYPAAGTSMQAASSYASYAQPAPQQYTGEQRQEQQIQDVMRLNDITREQAIARITQATASQQGKVAMPTDPRTGSPIQGLVYDPSVNAYRDPMTRNFYAGFDPKLGAVFSADQTRAIQGMFKAPDGGIVTTDAFRQGVTALQGALQFAQSNPLPMSGSVQGAQDSFTLGLPPELASLQQVIDAGGRIRTGTVTGTDLAEYAPGDIYAGYRAQLAERRKGAIEDIHAQAKAQYDDQVQKNKEALARTEVMMASLGTIGSTQDLQFTSDTIREGDKALRSIADSERKAINDAMQSFEQQDFQLAVQQMEQARQDRKDYWDMNMQLYQLKQNYTDRLEQKAQDRKAVAQGDLSNALKMGASFDDIPVEKQTEWAAAVGLTGAGLKSYLDLNRQSVLVSQAKDKQEAAKAQYELYSKSMDLALKVDPSKTLTLYNPDGTTSVVHGMKDVTQDYSVSTVTLGAGKQGPAGQYLVTHDKAGNVVHSAYIGEHYVAPHFNADTNTWETYDPMSDTTTTVFNAGQFGEGAAGASIGNDYVQDVLIPSFGKPTQEPGGGFSHENLTGWDFPVSPGTAISAPKINGIVVATGSDNRNYKNNPGGMSAYGNYVDVMDIDTGARFRFGHLSSVEVATGQRVDPSMEIGKSGNTGFSTAPHLHFEILNSDGSHVMPNRNAARNKKPVGAAKAVPPAGVYGPPEYVPKVPSDPFAEYKQATGVQLNPKSRRDQAVVAKWKADQPRREASISAVEQRTKTLKQLEIQRALSTIPTYKVDTSRQGVIGQAAAAELAFDRIIAAKDEIDRKGNKAPGVSDFELLDAFVQYARGGGQITESQVNTLLRGVGLRGNLETLWTQATGGGALLSPDARNELIGLAEKNYNVLFKRYQTRIKSYQKTLDAEGIDYKVPEISPLSFSTQTVPISEQEAKAVTSTGGQITPEIDVPFVGPDGMTYTLQEDGTYNVE